MLSTTVRRAASATGAQQATTLSADWLSSPVVGSSSSSSGRVMHQLCPDRHPPPLAPDRPRCVLLSGLPIRVSATCCQGEGEGGRETQHETQHATSHRGTGGHGTRSTRR